MSLDQGHGPPFAGDWQIHRNGQSGNWTIGEFWVDMSTLRYCIEIADRHCNAFGVMHGGAMMTFMDSQVLLFQATECRGLHTPTISMNVDFLAPPGSGDWLVAAVDHVKTTRTMIVTRALVRVGDRVVAQSTAIYSNTFGKDAQ